MKILFVLFLTTLSFGQLLPSEEEMASMSTFEKQLLYEKNAKSPVVAIASQAFIPSLGYAYIDDWKRGLKFTAIEISLCIVGLLIIDSSRYNQLDAVSAPFFVSAGILHFYQYTDLYKKTKKYNQQIHNKIFGKKDNDFSFLILPTSNGAYLNLSYKF